MPGQLISLGSINVDLQARIDHWPQPGEAVVGHNFVILGGGKAANVALVAQRLGVETRLIGHVGDDESAKRALAGVEAFGVDISEAKSITGTVTGQALVFVRADGEKSIVLAPNANDFWQPEQAEHIAETIARSRDGSVLVVDMEIPPFVVEHALRAARSRGLTVILDPSPATRVQRELLLLVDYLTPNQSEAGLLLGWHIENKVQAAEAAHVLVELGVGTCLIKLDDGGCVVVNHHEVFFLPPFKVEVEDKTGAGDAFAGALAVAIIEGKPLKEATRFAMAAAALAVTRYGAQPSYPTLAEIEDLIAKQGKN